MPWSDWIQGADIDISPFRRLKHDPAEVVSAFDDVQIYIAPSALWNAVQFRAGAPTIPVKPFLLFTMTEGEDYEAIPGSDPSDPARFAEYEDDEGTWLRWEWLNGPIEVDHVSVDFPGGGTLWLSSPTDYPDLDEFPFIPGYQGPGIPSGDPPPITHPFGTFTGHEAPGTDLEPPPDPGGVEAFTVVAMFNEPPIEELGEERRVYFNIPDPVAFWRPPRWRYWIPGDLPLRQFHRDDGMGGTPPRAFGGTSRIRSGRAYGYD